MVSVLDNFGAVDAALAAKLVLSWNASTVLGYGGGSITLEPPLSDELRRLVGEPTTATSLVVPARRADKDVPSHQDLGHISGAPSRTAILYLTGGGLLTALAMKVRTDLTGSIYTIEYSASTSEGQGSHKAIVRTGDGTLVKQVTHNTGNWTVENLAISMRERRLFGSHGAVLTISTGRWLVEAASKPFPNPAKNPGKALLNLQLNALYDADHDAVAPHGLIGQSYDGDDVGVDGAQDEYKGKDVVTTKAMAEGAIEGDASDYEMTDKFATDFKYTRFDAVASKPRDVAKLAGKKHAGNKSMRASASPDVEEAEAQAA